MSIARAGGEEIVMQHGYIGVRVLALDDPAKPEGPKLILHSERLLALVVASCVLSR